MQRVFLEYRGHQVALPPGGHVIGRGFECALRLSDGTVSREHVRIEVDGEIVRAADLRSRNGTLLNGRALTEPCPVQNGDVLRIGDQVIRIVIVPSSTPGFDEETADRMIHVAVPAPAGARTKGRPRLLTPTLDRLMTAAEQAAAERPAAARLERRKNRRFNVDVVLLYVSDRFSVDATAHDLSLGGVFVSTDRVDEIGARCDITFFPEARPAVPCRGVVRHVSSVPREQRPAGMGIEFTHLGLGGREWLGALFEAA